MACERQKQNRIVASYNYHTYLQKQIDNERTNIQ